MAIYRTGQASMDANGYITGYGTKWKTALTLIRPGATIVFASNPVEYATISEIVSDTSLRAITTSGRSITRGDYVILLHDSLTVDGLAQDVAETLRYYQGQETMYEHFVEFLKGFDWQRMEKLGEKAYADAKAAEASANAAKASETNANASKNAAAGSATTASQKRRKQQTVLEQQRRAKQMRTQAKQQPQTLPQQPQTLLLLPDNTKTQQQPARAQREPARETQAQARTPPPLLPAQQNQRDKRKGE